MKKEVIDGVTHVLVPEEAWNKILDVFDRIERMGEKK